jgi:hypothetical protein
MRSSPIIYRHRSLTKIHFISFEYNEPGIYICYRLRSNPNANVFRRCHNHQTLDEVKNFVIYENAKSCKVEKSGRTNYNNGAPGSQHSEFIYWFEYFDGKNATNVPIQKTIGNNPLDRMFEESFAMVMSDNVDKASLNHLEEIALSELEKLEKQRQQIAEIKKKILGK